MAQVASTKGLPKRKRCLLQRSSEIFLKLSEETQFHEVMDLAEKSTSGTCEGKALQCREAAKMGNGSLGSLFDRTP